jgi:hypothetical protein
MFETWLETLLATWLETLLGTWSEKREIMIIEGGMQVIRQFLSHKLDQVLFGLGL